MLTTLKGSLLWRWRKGFKATSKVFYDLSHGAHGDYLNHVPDAAFKPLALTNSIMSRTLLHDKLLFERVIGRYTPVPPTLALIERGKVFGPTPDGPVRDREALLAYAQTQPLALKPALGAKGKGVYKLSWQGGPLLDGVAISLAELDTLLSSLDYYLVVPWIAQADYAATVFPDSGNSLRLITMRDPGDGHRPFIAAAVQKFGTRASAPTDNWSRGALFAPVALETGVMTAGLADFSKTGGKPVWHPTHPDTGARIEGVTVPRWAELTAALLGLLGALPIFNYVGWDVLVTNDGFYIIEGNNAPTIVSLQLTRPALSDPRVRRFVVHHRLNVPGLRS